MHVKLFYQPTKQSFPIGKRLEKRLIGVNIECESMLITVRCVHFHTSMYYPSTTTLWVGKISREEDLRSQQEKEQIKYYN